MKKLFFSVSLIFFALFITTVSSYALTTNNKDLDAIGNSVKNIIGGAENKVENAAKDAANAGKNATNSLGDAAGKAGENIKNSAKNASDAMKNGTQNLEDSMNQGAQNMGNSIENIMSPADYNAERTAVQNDNTGNTFLNSTTWAWIIIAVIAVAIIAIFWYYTTSQSKK